MRLLNIISGRVLVLVKTEKEDFKGAIKEVTEKFITIKTEEGFLKTLKLSDVEHIWEL